MFVVSDQEPITGFFYFDYAILIEVRLFRSSHPFSRAKT